jgi:predicted enzyme related to lactoylglutathione lyase
VVGCGHVPGTPHRRQSGARPRPCQDLVYAGLRRHPYFDEPFYFGFNIGGFELGLVPDAPLSRPPGGVVVLWGVDDVGATCAHLLALGARMHEEPKDVGGGITAASVLDPFGNILGLIHNPSFDPRAVK